MNLDKQTAEYFISAMEQQGRLKDFVAGLAKAGEVDFVRAVLGVMGSDRFHQLLAGGSRLGLSDPIAAAIKEKNVEVANLLIEVLGTVPHKIESLHPSRGSRPTNYHHMVDPSDAVNRPTLRCEALNAALGLSYATLEVDRQHPKFVPDVALVKMVLDAMPDVHPDTLLNHGVRMPHMFYKVMGERNVSLMSLALISRSEEFLQLMLDREPVFTVEDLKFAVHMGNASVAARIIEEMGTFPDILFLMMSGLDSSGQRRLLPALQAADIERDALGRDAFVVIDSRLGALAPEVAMMVSEKRGASLESLLMSAACAGNAETVRELLKAGADHSKLLLPSSGAKEFVTALHEAQGADVVLALLEAGADPNAGDSTGAPPIVRWLARSAPYEMQGHVAMASMIATLAEGGADMAIKHGGRTLPQMAGKWEDVVRRAVRSGKVAQRLEGALGGGEPVSEVRPASFGGVGPL